MDEEEIFTTALKMESADQRAAYLDQACAGNAHMRHEIEELLCAHVRAGGFLENAAAAWNAHLSIGDQRSMAERPGTMIGPYKLIEQIGEGGFGIVFMADQQQPVRRKVAVKVLKPGMDTKQVIARFEAERQALALMDHPNIARVLDAGATASGRPYFVMDLVRGVPITEFCDSNQLTPKKRLELFVSVCQTVQHAHQKGIIHRDLKPTNILVTLHDGTPVVKIIDFGIAKALGQQLTDKTLVTGFAQMIGTPLYMSPEQAELSGLDMDTRSDIYSLGVLLYELLTGTTPFEKERLHKGGYDEMRRIIREEEPPKPSARLSALGQAATTVSERRRSDPRRLGQLFRGELDWIVMKALEKDRNRRYESASGFAADVLCYLRDEPVQACPPSVTYRLQKIVCRNKVALASTSLVAVALLLGTAVSIWLAVEATDARQLADQAADRERKMANETREKQRYTAALLAGHQVDVGLNRLNDGNLEGLLDLLDARETADDLPELRDPIGRLWASARDRWEGRLHVQPYSNNVAFSPDSQVLAILTSRTGTVRLIEMDTKQSRPFTIRVPKETGAIGFSPDGRLLATHSVMLGGRLWDTATGLPVGKPLEHTSTDGYWPESYRNVLAFSPDGKLLTTGGWDGTVRVWEASTGQPHAGPFSHGPTVVAVAFSPNGKWLASGSTGGTARLWDLATGKANGPDLQGGGHVRKILFTADSRRVITVSTHGVMVWETETGRLVNQLTREWVTDASLAPDGLILATGNANGKVHLWDIQSGIVVDNPQRNGRRVASVMFSPNGKRLAVFTDDATTRIYEVGDRLRLTNLLPGCGESWMHAPATWSPDGRFLATAGHGKLWQVEERDLRTIPLAPPNHVVVSPDGKRLARCLPDENNVLIQDTTTGRLLEILQINNVTCQAFSPDGKMLATGHGNWRVQIWRNDGKQAGLISAVVDQVYGLAWSPDGTRIMVATPLAGLVTEFDRTTAKAIDQPFNHGDWVRAVCYSPDGGMIATVGGDHSASAVRLWSTRLGPRHPPLVLNARLPGGAYYRNPSVTFSRDGQLLCVQPPIGTAVLFRLPPPPDLHQIRLRTWLALGVRRDSKGVLQMMAAEEWSKVQEELAALDRKQEPIRWEALESAFTKEIMGQARTIDQIVANVAPIVPVFEKIVEQNKAKYGPDHTLTHSAMETLASMYGDLAQFDKEESVLHDLLQSLKKQAPLSPGTADALALLGLNLIHQRKYAEAESLVRESLTIRENVQPNLWSTFDTKSILGGALLGQKRYADAEPLLLAGYDGMKRRATEIPASGMVRLYEAIERQVQLYDALSQNGKANEWREKLAAYRHAENNKATAKEK